MSASGEAESIRVQDAIDRVQDIDRFWSLSQDLLVIATLDGEWVRANPALERILGWSLEDVRAAGRRGLIHPGDRPKTLEQARKLAQGEPTLHFENRLQHRDGTYRWLSWTAMPSDGLLYCVGRDVTDEKASEARYKLLADHATDLIVRTSRDGVCCYASPAARDILGYEPSELVGSRLLLITHPDDKQAIVSGLEALFSGASRQVRTTFRARHKDGRWVFLESMRRCILDEGGHPTEIVSVVRDITDRKLQEEALAAAQEHAQAAAEHLRVRDRALEAIGEGVVIVDARDPAYPIVSANAAFETMTGYSASQVIGRNCRFLQGEETDRTVLAELKEALRQGREHKCTLLNYRKDGTRFFNELLITPVKDGRGNLTHFVGVQSDVTDQIRAYDNLKESEQRHRTLLQELDRASQWLEETLQASRMMAWEWNFETGEAIRSSTSLEVVGLSTGAISDFYAHLHADDRSKYQAALNAAAQTGGYFAVEYRFNKPTGEMAWISETGHIDYGPGGQMLRARGLTCDVTDRIKLQDQLRQAQKMEAVGQLTGGLAHDFNNLLTVILGNAELLTDRTEDASLRDIAETIQLAAERGSDLNQKLLAFGRRQSLTPKPVRLDGALGNLAGLLRRTLGEHIDLVVEARVGDYCALVDQAQLESALINLAVNARDAMPGGGKLRIGAEEIASPTEQVTEFLAITVSDTGFGMPPEVLEHAFEPFFTTKEMGKGSGLGLSMVYGFAQQSGGYVNISSEVGAGTSVTIVLPAVPADGPPVAAGSGVPALPSGKERVLVVEDEPHVLQFVTTQLLNLGYEVTAVSTGVDALDLLAKEAAFDLLFSDVVLPKGVSGVELARRAKRLRPALKVLLTSGYPEEVFEQHGRPEEGTRVLRKPYRRAELAETLRTVLRSPGA